MNDDTMHVHEFKREIAKSTVATRELIHQAGYVNGLAPEGYWTSDVKVVLPQYEKVLQGDIFVFADYDSYLQEFNVEFGKRSFDDYVQKIETDGPISVSDLRHLFIGHAILHDLTIRGLRPERLNAFAEIVDEENGLFGELMLSSALDQGESYATVQEFFAGDIDKIAAVNVARFAIGTVCESFKIEDPDFRSRVTGFFRRELEETLSMAKLYKHTAKSRFKKTPVQAQRLFVEHINTLKLAAAYPKTEDEVQGFLTVYE